MPIIVSCEHCTNPAKFAVTPDESMDTVMLRPKINVAKDQRHICESLTCLGKELEFVSKYFHPQAFWFKK